MSVDDDALMCLGSELGSGVTDFFANQFLLGFGLGLTEVSLGDTLLCKSTAA